MRLEELDAETLLRAVTLYCELAYEPHEIPTHVHKAVPKVEATFAEILGWFLDESDQAESAAHRRYAMRLGNRNYPCMKMVLEEILYPGEFFFYVDTHDDVDLEPDAPEYEAWQALREYNHELKDKIESTWWNAGLATIRELKDRIPDEDVTGPVAEAHLEKIIMVIDDDRDMADATAQALKHHGYRTVEVFDPDGAVAEARQIAPDAIIVDIAVAGQSGREICRRLRKDPRTAAIPLALVAPRLDFFKNIPEADACIFKPFDAGVLYRIVDHLVTRQKRTDTQP